MAKARQGGGTSFEAKLARFDERLSSMEHEMSMIWEKSRDCDRDRTEFISVSRSVRAFQKLTLGVLATVAAGLALNWLSTPPPKERAAAIGNAVEKRLERLVERLERREGK